MAKLKEWKMAQKIRSSGNRGMIIGMCVAVLIIVAVIIAVIKIDWLKRTFGRDGCCCDDYDDDFYIDADDESGCAYTSESDLEK
ncbi:MAG: hypothetical protein FWC70_13250 [Defluviitaleaceae bacterium]|nr:hypothetical protein [Defluviitaleaceae bacterium]